MNKEYGCKFEKLKASGLIFVRSKQIIKSLLANSNTLKQKNMRSLLVPKSLMQSDMVNFHFDCDYQ